LWGDAVAMVPGIPQRKHSEMDREFEVLSTTMYVGGKPVLVYSYNPCAGLRSVFRYQNFLPDQSPRTRAKRSSTYLNACSVFDVCTSGRLGRGVGRVVGPVMKALTKSTPKDLELKLTNLAAASFDWPKIHMLNAANAVHLVFIDYVNTEGEHVVQHSVHLYERVLSIEDIRKIAAEQVLKLSGVSGVRHQVAA